MEFTRENYEDLVRLIITKVPTVEIAELLKCDRAYIYKELKLLVESKVLIRTGQKRAVRYALGSTKLIDWIMTGKKGPAKRVEKKLEQNLLHFGIKEIAERSSIPELEEEVIEKVYKIRDQGFVKIDGELLKVPNYLPKTY